MGKKSMKNARTNQGNQKSAGSPGNIKRTAIKGPPARKGPVSSKHGRDKSIGR